MGWESHPTPLILATAALTVPLISHGIYINAEGLSFEEAAGVPLVSLTVWQVRRYSLFVCVTLAPWKA